MIPGVISCILEQFYTSKCLKVSLKYYLYINLVALSPCFALLIFVGYEKLFRWRTETEDLDVSPLSPPEIGLKTPSPQSAVAAPDGSAWQKQQQIVCGPDVNRNTAPAFARPSQPASEDKLFELMFVTQYTCGVQ